MRKLIAAVMALGLMVGLSWAKDMTLVEDGVAKCVIVVPKSSASVAWFSAGELQRHIKWITGAEVSVLSDDQDIPKDVIKILVGETSLTKAVGIDPNKQLKPQEFLVKFVDDKTLVLVGQDYHLRPGPYDDRKFYDTFCPEALDLNATIDTQNGWCATSYAVYEFLERLCDVHWYQPGEIGTVYTPRKTLVVDARDIQRKPAILWRSIPFGGNFGMWLGPNGKEPDGRDRSLFVLRNKGGGEGWQNGHAYYGYFDRFRKQNPEKPQLWEGAHPDYFAHYKDGHESIQMCFSSTGLVEQVVKDAGLWFNKGQALPGAVVGPNYFGLLQNDMACDCECDACSKLRKPANERGEIYWRNNETMWQFVDKVSKRFAEEYPGKFVMQAAYLDTMAPPETVHLGSNVLIGACVGYRTDWVNGDDSSEFKIYKSWATQYPGQMGTIWTYPCFPNESCETRGYKCFPGFFAHKIQEFYRMFASDGTRGIMNCGAGELVDAYLIMKYMDDPSWDVDAVMTKLFSGYYGDAGPGLQKMYNEMEEAYWNRDNYPNRRHSIDESVAWSTVGTPERMARWQGMVDEAKTLVKTDAEKQRVSIFENGIWKHMTTGFETYQFKVKYKDEVEALRKAEPRHLDIARLKTAVTNGDPDKVDWTGIEPVKIDRTSYGYPSKSRIADLWLGHDGTYLYMKLTDHCDGSLLRRNDSWFWGKRWEMFFGPTRETSEGKDKPPYRQLGLQPIDFLNYWPEKFGEVQYKASTDGKGWYIRVSMPLEKLAVDGSIKPGSTFYMQLIGPESEGADVLALTPISNPSSYHDMPRAASATLAK